MDSTKKNVKQIQKSLKGLWNLSPATEKEPFFSSTGCPVCKSPLGGDRYTFTATTGKKPTGKRTEVECCVDCYEHLFT